MESNNILCENLLKNKGYDHIGRLNIESEMDIWCYSRGHKMHFCDSSIKEIDRYSIGLNQAVVFLSESNGMIEVVKPNGLYDGFFVIDESNKILVDTKTKYSILDDYKFDSQYKSLFCIAIHNSHVYFIDDYSEEYVVSSIISDDIQFNEKYKHAYYDYIGNATIIGDNCYITVGIEDGLKWGAICVNNEAYNIPFIFEEGIDKIIPNAVISDNAVFDRKGGCICRMGPSKRRDDEYDGVPLEYVGYGYGVYVFHDQYKYFWYFYDINGHELEYEENVYNDDIKHFEIQISGRVVTYHSEDNVFLNYSPNNDNQLVQTDNYDKDTWDALTDGQYGDYPGPGFDDYEGMGF